MAHDIAALLGRDGVTRVADLAGRVDRHTVGRWVRAGRLERPHPGVVVLPERAGEWRVRALAAVLATDGVLSHTSALTAWGVAPALPQLHVSIPAERRAPALRAVTTHRVRRLERSVWGPYPVTSVPRAVVDTWGLAHGRSAEPRLPELARAAVIETLRDGRAGAHDLRSQIELRPALPDRRTLTRLIAAVEDGSHSELELWGVQHVLRGPGMPAFVQQHPVRLRSGTIRLDAAVLRLKVAVELDGAAFHGSAEARERDTRRDVALAALGWVVLRFSYRRLTTDPAGCRREILAVCAAREAMLRPR